ncbi:MFS transporter [Streptomyces gibsoniae]|uniref:MFS transporter n=1 Tax=Streptomyces gibsoniae TaxID=3075529 RepID=A0ABU2U4H9_9ACTN|nr:MFS transporter [Streptomyces sp. DSM 41699]MDT0468134.1 MFS transporter [Streptomyces sp. DSM 41699]
MNQPKGSGGDAESGPQTPRTATGSPWQPLLLRVFRTLWLAQFVSNIGGWMQTVGAQWLITEQSGSAGLVALVQTAGSLPVLLLGILAGALADIVDRRRLLLVAQVVMFLAAGLLAALTATGSINPYGVLLLTFVLGCGTALMNPAWQAIQPELVPRDQIPAAATLGGVNMNLARAVGPALGGLVVAQVGTAAVFALNAVSFLATMAALLIWRRSAERDPLGAERMLPAVRAGYRYVRHAPRVRRALLRALLFVPAGAALWSLLPVIADRRLGLSAGGYGLLLGAIGVGAVLGAVLLPRVRRRWSSNLALTVGGMLFAVALAVLALVRVPWVVAVVLVLSGVAWVAVLSTLNSQMQVTVPEWVRARALAVYLTVFQGGMAVGAAVWGAVADAVGAVTAVSVAAVLLAVGSLVGYGFAVPDTPLDRTPSLHWAAPVMMLDPAEFAGPVLVTVAYRVPADRADAFVAAMNLLGRSRLRTGALHWNLYQDGADPHQYLETFLVASWEEHLRQHGGRLTGFDREVEERTRAMVESATSRRVSHYLPARTTGGS